MKRILRSIAYAPLVVTLLFSASSLANAASVLDQQQPSIDFGRDSLTIGGTYRQALSQVVTAGIIGDLVAVAFPFELSEAGGNLLVSINSTNGLSPTNDVLASKLVAPETIPPFGEGPLFRVIEFSSPAFFNAGDKFGIVLQCEVPGANQCFGEMRQSPDGDLYLGGNRYIAHPPWTWSTVRSGQGDDYPKDLPFQTFVQPVPLQAAILLFGSGLMALGLAGVGYQRRSKNSSP